MPLKRNGMKTLRRILATLLSCLALSPATGTVPNVVSGPDGSRSLTVSHRSLKRLKERRARAFLAAEPLETVLPTGGKVTYRLSADCSFRSFVVRMEDIKVYFPGSDSPCPIEDVLGIETEAANRKEALMRELARAEGMYPPGSPEGKGPHAAERLFALREALHTQQLSVVPASMAQQATVDVLNRFAQSILGES